MLGQHEEYWWGTVYSITTLVGLRIETLFNKKMNSKNIKRFAGRKFIDQHDMRLPKEFLGARFDGKC